MVVRSSEVTKFLFGQPLLALVGWPYLLKSNETKYCQIGCHIGDTEIKQNVVGLWSTSLNAWCSIHSHYTSPTVHIYWSFFLIFATFFRTTKFAVRTTNLEVLVFRGTASKNLNFKHREGNDTHVLKTPSLQNRFVRTKHEILCLNG